MTFHWRKSAACDIDEILDDLNPQMKNLEREIRGVDSDSVTTGSVTTDVLVLDPVTEPTASTTAWKVYHDSTSDVIEVVSPGDVRGIVAIDVEGPTTTPSTMTIRATMSGDVFWSAYGFGGAGPQSWVAVRDYDDADPLYVAGDDGQLIIGASIDVGGVLFDGLRRGLMMFDTSAVPQAPSSGTITVVTENIDSFTLNGGAGQLRLFNYPRSPLDASVPDAADYNMIRLRGGVRSSDTFPTYAAQVAEVALVFTLNVFGLVNIHQNGFSAFAIRHWKDLATLPAPTGGAGDADNITFYGYDAVLAKRPLLTLNFT